MNFSQIRFGDLFHVPQKNGLTRPKKVRGVGVPMVNMGELFAHPRIHNLSMDRVPLAETESSFLLSQGDLLFARQSLVLSGAGQCSIFLGNREPTTFESHLIRCRLDSNRANPSFYFNFFRSSDGRRVIEAIVEQGAGASGIRGSDLINVSVPYPPLHVQNEIADIFDSLDDRITLLRETNTTLEAIAQALFKSWFVDFDPVRAKQAGQQPEGMDEATAALFPDSLEESELGLVPSGWRVGTVADLGEVICGKTPPTSNPENYGDEVPFITIPDMHGRLLVTTTNRSLSRVGADSQKKKYLPPGAICVSCIATPGLVVRVTTESQTNQQINSVVPHTLWGHSFPLFLLRRIGDAVRAGGSGGSVFHNLSKSGFEELRVLLSTPVIAKRFDEVVEPLVARIEEAQRQAQTLAALRDTLLPRLISGSLRLPEAYAIPKESQS